MGLGGDGEGKDIARGLVGEKGIYHVYGVNKIIPQSFHLRVSPISLCMDLYLIVVSQSLLGTGSSNFKLKNIGHCCEH